MFDPKVAARMALATALFGVSVAASAALVTSRGALGGDDSIAWGQLGSDSDTVTQPAAVTSNGGRSASASNGSGGDLSRFNEGGVAYAGNFALGDELLTTLGTPGPIRIDFTNAIGRVGAQIQSFVFGEFDGVISVFDASDTLLETHSVAGLSDSAGDDSAIFIGITRAAADIRRVEFDITLSDPQQFDDLAINRLDFGLRGTGPANPIPTPSTLALAGIGLFAASRIRRRPA